MKLTSTRITDAEFTLYAAQRTLAIAVHKEQMACAHDSIAEAGGSPPTRICLNCGMTEVGWGPGYKVLTSEGPLTPPGIPLDELYRLRQGLIVTDAMKGPLIRREVTVADLLDQKLEETLSGLRNPDESQKPAPRRPRP